MKKVFLIILGLVLTGAGCTATNNTGVSVMQDQTEKTSSVDGYQVSTSDAEVFVSDNKWKKMDDPSVYAKNFEAREKGSTEEFAQVVTIFLNPMTPADKVGTQLSDDEFLEMFTTFPKTVTMQIRRDKGAYWLLSRQTFSVADSYLASLNPEVSSENFRLYQDQFENEIYTTRYSLGFEF